MTGIQREQLLYRLRELDEIRRPGVRAFYDRLGDSKYLPFGGRALGQVRKRTSDPEVKGILRDYMQCGAIPSR